MKLNQFARLTPEFSQQLTELARIGLPADPKGDFADTAAAMYAAFFPEAYQPAAKQDKFAQIAVDSRQNLTEWLASGPTQMTRQNFYNVALQLLGFEAFTDFDLADPLTFMAATKLPSIDHDLLDTEDFLKASYLLLMTRTKHLVNFLDDLANRGFFKDFQSSATQPKPLLFNGKVQQVFDARQAIRELVWIESDVDSDHDGMRDLLEATIYRPKATEQGLKVPVLFTANPYFHGTNDVTAATHVPETVLAVKSHGASKAEVTATPAQTEDLPKRVVTGEVTEAEAYAEENSMYAFNDYFLARGFAVVYSAGVGTRYSDGFRTIGGPEETAGAVAVIEWLTGKRRAFANRTSGVAIKAWWSTGKVAMTGKSYLATLAIAAATTGVEGLKTIIADAGISSWYDYYRENGLVVAPGGFQGEDADVLAVDTFSRQKSGGDMIRIKSAWERHLAAITRDQDRTTGAYTAWWDARNYRKNAANVKADVVLIHGLNDWNVKPKNAIRFWQAISDLPIQKKLILHQGQHVYVHNVRSLDFLDMMNLWLTHELLGVANDVADVLPNVIVQDNVTPQTWSAYTDFANPEAEHVTTEVNLKNDFEAATDQFTDHATATFAAQHDTSASFEKAIITPNSAYANSRLWLTQPVLERDQILEGIPHLELTLAVDAPTGILSVRLVDLGEAKRFGETAATVAANDLQLGFDFKTTDIVEFKPAAKPTPSKLITLGHINLQNPKNAYEVQQITPGQFFHVSLDLQPTHYHLPTGRQLALIIHGADMAQTIRPTKTTHYQVDLAKSTLTLPFRL
ncbi:MULTISPECIES: Xaa-Pro dipeptidyl-peptidase [Lacticaseibacillus]|uniref:Xaa-Pro dipeptidyl-peptidase n=2 Tax=Lacticaseibacillus TaxID=2759736 RepID=A0AAN1EYX5_LACCA|nr:MULTISPECIES: Xaa-Pro dipeptidyl-peptidase [Lacticaseibacillus]ARY91693.1 Xaa-Pro dipeptidyl-peptidase [Lacticaseibacillus casei]KAB1968848.1 Xaa-Pro dipeptidyl-peptidase [Lacticaseibacillus casei]WLV79593.1 Xaa-Pro dipeptidyl-peptidase [Lacticaseibacillus sp. NCIMB 15473]WNX23553.1 Xaa-Pro dipeptidyl-peptidase [Lacticaseibacillus casei]WNX26328.1 Xaa-Pro dipeptidyl-peptidase [Lacticaseibacillus casei]